MSKRRTKALPDTGSMTKEVQQDDPDVPMGRRIRLTVEELKQIQTEMRAAILAKPPWTTEQIINAICKKHGIRAETAKAHLQGLIDEIAAQREMTKKLDQHRVETLLRETMNDPDAEIREKLKAAEMLDRMFGGISLNGDEFQQQAEALTRQAIDEIDKLKTPTELEDYERRLKAKVFNEEV